VLASSDEMAVVSGVLAFADRPVRELMTPRTSIVAIPEGMLAAEAAHVFTQSGYSRYPVYRGTIDEIVGVVHSFDLLRLGPDAPVTVRPALLVQGTMRAADLMLDMQRGRGHLAVVLDEFGGTAGLVTFDDLLKNLVREVFDEAPESTALSPGAGGAVDEAAVGVRLVELEGNAPAARLAEELGVPVLARDVRTVGGLLILALGRIPRAGERFVLRGLEFDILAATATKVERVVVRRAPVRTVTLDRPEEPRA
jgi:putative hemolysin